MKVSLLSHKLQNSGFEVIDEVVSDHIEEFGDLEDLEDNIVYQIYQKLLPEIEVECNKHLEKYRYMFESLEKEHSDLSFPKEAPIHIYFVQQDFYQKTLSHYYSNNHQDLSCTLGLMSTTGGEGITKSMETFFEDKFTLVVTVPKNEDIEDLKGDIYGVLDLVSILNTLTHELNHALLFIINSGGLTPEDVDVLYESDEFDLNVADCMRGEMFLRDEVKELNGECFDDIEDPDALMEFYVENVGLDFIHATSSFKNGEIAKYVE